MLDLGVVVKGIHGHVFAYAALFVAAMGHHRGQRQVIVDPHCTKLQHPAGAHGLEDVGSPDRGGQAVDHIVSFSQHFLFGAEAGDDDDRAKDLVLHNLSIVAILRNDGWFKEEAFLQPWDSGSLATCHDVCAIAQGTLNKALDGGTLGGRDQWTHIGAFVCRIADTNLLDFAEERLQEFVIDLILHVDASCGGAVLAAVDEAPDKCSIGGSFDICIIVDDKWSFAAQFKVYMLDGFSARAHDVLATLGAAGDREIG